MSNFAKPKPRFDPAVAAKGVWFYPTDENDYEYGGFLCALVDQQTPRYKLAAERIKRQYENKNGKGVKLGEDFVARVFVETSLLDWDVKDADGNKMPFSPEKAIEYFTDGYIDDETGKKFLTFGWVMMWLDAKSQNVANYQAERAPEKN